MIKRFCDICYTEMEYNYKNVCTLKLFSAMYEDVCDTCQVKLSKCLVKLTSKRPNNNKVHAIVYNPTKECTNIL